MALDEENKKILKQKFNEMKEEVKIILFTNENDTRDFNKQAQDFTKEILKDLSELTDKIKWREEKYDSEEAKKLGVYNNPTIVLEPEKYKIFYNGAPSGHEFAGFIETIVMISNGTNLLSEETKNKIKDVKEKLIQIFVTPTCPYCVRAVLTANMLALANPNIKAECIEATENQELSNKNGVSSVPHIVVDEKHSFIGALPEPQFVEEVLKSA